LAMTPRSAYLKLMGVDMMRKRKRFYYQMKQQITLSLDQKRLNVILRQHTLNGKNLITNILNSEGMCLLT
ncbi:MAG: hypothetical protein ACJ0G1_00005, partial [Gammaproteobacteria bacterium]